MPKEAWRQDLLDEVERKVLAEKIALAKRLAELREGIDNEIVPSDVEEK